MQDSENNFPTVNKKVVLNALPIRAGGGLQKTTSLIRVLGESETDLSKFSIIVRKGSLLEELSDDIKLQKYVVDDSTAGRFRFEIQSRFLIEKETLCFTLSGPVMLGSVNHLINVTECAYSNLFYPEIDFWSHFTGIAKNKKAWIDIYRKKMIKAADFWIFQTDVLRERAVEQFGFPEDRTYVVRISPSINVGKDKVSETQREFFDTHIPKGFRMLFLNGPNPNKRIHLVPKIVKELTKRGMDNVVVITTMPEENQYAQFVRNCFVNEGLEKQYRNIGRISTNQVSSCIDCCDALCTFSTLESFSNNFIEAWRMGKPLIATDSDWARAAAENGALYVDVSDPCETAESIFNLFVDQRAVTFLLGEGEKRLDSYSSPSEKLVDYLSVLADAEQLGSCPSVIRERIRW